LRTHTLASAACKSAMHHAPRVLAARVLAPVARGKHGFHPRWVYVSEVKLVEVTFFLAPSHPQTSVRAGFKGFTSEAVSFYPIL
jgi:hypothetical protein